MKKQTIKLNESQLRKIIVESISEVNMQRIHRNAERAQDLQHEMENYGLRSYKGQLNQDVTIENVTNFLNYLVQNTKNLKYTELYNTFNQVIANLGKVVSQIESGSENKTNSMQKRYLDVFLNIAKKVGIYDDIVNRHSRHEETRYYNEYYHPSETEILIDKVNHYIIDQSKYYDPYGGIMTKDNWDWNSVRRKTGAKLFELLDANKDKFTPEELQVIKYIKEHRSLPNNSGPDPL